MSARVHVTDHAHKRSKQRLGLNAEAADRMAMKAWLAGLQHHDTTGALNRYLSKLYWQHKNANNVRLYGEHVYVFCHQTLVTILTLPNRFKKTVKYLFDERSKNPKPAKPTNYFGDDYEDTH